MMKKLVNFFEIDFSKSCRVTTNANGIDIQKEKTCLLEKSEKLKTSIDLSKI